MDYLTNPKEVEVCKSKKRYPSQAKARRAARKHKEIHGGLYVRFYKCPGLPGDTTHWHLTTKPQNGDTPNKVHPKWEE
jgi:hypothetical protein